MTGKAGVAIRAGEIRSTDEALTYVVVFRLRRCEPLHADLAGGRIGNFSDDRLDQHLGATHIKLTHHRSERAEYRWRRTDDQRIGLLMGLDGRRGRIRRATRLTGFGNAGWRDAGQGRGDALQDRYQILRVGIAQIDDLGIAAVLERGIKMSDQGAHLEPCILGSGKQD